MRDVGEPALLINLRGEGLATLCTTGIFSICTTSRSLHYVAEGKSRKALLGAAYRGPRPEIGEKCGLRHTQFQLELVLWAGHVFVKPR